MYYDQRIKQHFYYIDKIIKFFKFPVGLVVQNANINNEMGEHLRFWAAPLDSVATFWETVYSRCHDMLAGWHTYHNKQMKTQLNFTSVIEFLNTWFVISDYYLLVTS
jgi:hypothetical protein